MKRHKKHRRVHGVKSSRKSNMLITLGSVAVGYFAADTINEQVDKIVPKTKDATGAEVPNDTLAMAGELGLGGLLLIKQFGGGKFRMVQKVAGGVLAGAGLKRALKKAGIIKGYQNTPVIGMNRLGGYQNTPVIGRTGIPPQLSGIPAQLSGYRNQGSGIGSYNSQGSGVMGSVNGSGLLDNCR